MEARESYYDGKISAPLKIRGDFAKMHVRMIPKSTPEMKFAEVATHQPEYTGKCPGTIVGFGHEIFHGVSVAGYHCCFQLTTPLVAMSLVVITEGIGRGGGHRSAGSSVSQFKTVNTSLPNSMLMRSKRTSMAQNKKSWDKTELHPKS